MVEARRGRRSKGILALLGVLLITLGVGIGKGLEGEPEARPAPLSASARIPLPSEENPIGNLDFEVGEGHAALLVYDVTVEPSRSAQRDAAMVSFRVDCRSEDGQVPMESTGKATTNLFVSRGGSLRGQALTFPLPAGEVRCELSGTAPFKEPTDDGVDHLPVEVDFAIHSVGDGINAVTTPLAGATVIHPGEKQYVLDSTAPTVAAAHDVFATVRLTSCTVTGGSRDSGQANQCTTEMIGKKSSTALVRLFGYWYDQDNRLVEDRVLWSETAVVGYDTHHLPLHIRLAAAPSTPEEVATMRVLVRVDSLDGAPIVVHGDGTAGALVHSAPG